jgi:hypothetical protein
MFTNGLTDESRQRFREGGVQKACSFICSPPAGLLAAERSDVAAACAQLLRGGIVCAAGPEDRYVAAPCCAGV